MKVTCAIIITGNKSEQRIKMDRAPPIVSPRIGDNDLRTHFFEMNHDLIGV